jgi:hypothetical protein
MSVPRRYGTCQSLTRVTQYSDCTGSGLAVLQPLQHSAAVMPCSTVAVALARHAAPVQPKLYGFYYPLTVAVAGSVLHKKHRCNCGNPPICAQLSGSSQQTHVTPPGSSPITLTAVMPAKLLQHIMWATGSFTAALSCIDVLLVVCTAGAI